MGLGGAPQIGWGHMPDDVEVEDVKVEDIGVEDIEAEDVVILVSLVIHLHDLH